MTFVAHEDDSILFMNPDLLHDIQNGRCVRSVFLTAGDDGLGQTYWSSRENGTEAAYAQMAGVADSWVQSDAGISGHPMPLLTLAGAPQISLVFMQLPNSNPDGSGFAVYNNETLEQLYAGTIPQITAVDGSSSYTKSQLTATLTALMQQMSPDRIYT